MPNNEVHASANTVPFPDYCTIRGLVSCFNPQPEAPDLLADAQRLMESHPDSAMLLIDSIFYPEESLNKEAYMNYLITRVQARYKNYRPVAEDTLLFAACDYFARKSKDPAKTTLAFFCGGCVYREQKDYKKYMEQYKQAELYAAKTDDVDLKGLIVYNMGDLYFDKRSYLCALEKYQQAQRFYADNDDALVHCVLAVGQAFVYLDNPDSALFYFNKGRELAFGSGNREKLSEFLQNISVTYSQKNDYTNALECLNRAFDLNADSAEIPRYYLNFAKTYQGLGKQDSVNYYAALLQKTMPYLTDIYLKHTVNDFLASMFYHKGNYAVAYTHLQAKDSCIEEIMEAANVKAIAEVDRKYDVARHQAEKEKADSRSYKILLLLLLATLSLVFLSGLLYYLWQRHRQERLNSLLLKQRADKAIYINKVYQNGLSNIVALKNKINNLATKYSIKESGKNKGYEEILKTLKKMETDTRLGYADYITEFLHTQQILTSWQTCGLKEEDQLLVLLLHCNYAHTDIAAILQITPHVLTSRKSRLKDKLIKAGVTAEQINRLLPEK